MVKNIIICFLYITVLFSNINGMQVVAIVDTMWNGDSLGVTEEIEVFKGVLDTLPYFLISSDEKIFRASLINPDNIGIGCEPFSSIIGKVNDIAVIQNPVLPPLIVAIEEPDSGCKYFLGDTGTDWGYTKYLPLNGIPEVIKRFPLKKMLALSDEGIFIYDFTNSSDPVQISSYITPINDPKDVAVEAKRSYVLTDSVIIVFVNILNIDSIVIATFINIDINMYCLDVNNRVVFVGGEDKFCVFVGDSSYYKINEVEINGNVTDIMFSNNRIYAGVSKSQGSDFQGIKVYDVSNLEDIIFLDSCETPGGIGEMVLYGKYIYATLGSSGIAIIDNTITTGIIHPPQQNNKIKVSKIVSCHLLKGNLDLSYILTDNAIISIELFNIQGKHIYTLFKGQEKKGIHKRSFKIDGVNKNIVNGMNIILLKANSDIYDVISAPLIR